MGCFQSTAGQQIPSNSGPTQQVSASNANVIATTSSDGAITANGRKTVARLTKEEVDNRIVSSGSVLTKNQAGIDMKYAFVSQRGYYPNALFKPNQDSYASLPNFENNMAYFAVYDGHGPEGHSCAWFVRDNLPGEILSQLKLFPATTSGISKALTKAHIDINTKLHASTINDQLSGTTSISVLIIGRTLYVCNVGDSRAIMMSVNPSLSPKLEVSADVIAAVGDKKRLLARPLSSDQTPYRKDERERVIRRGARVLTQDQLDGVKPITTNFEELTLGDAIDEDGDPPRVWSTKGDYPGTAFTRSFGDQVAESIGVFAEPEILTRELNADDRYIIIASDGVFEFLTNQMVSDIIALYSDNPLSACKIVVSAAYELWLQYETRTDDITIIVIYLGDGKAFQSATDAEDNDDNDVIGVVKRGSAMNIISEAEITLIETRPVRRGFSREKKKKVIVSVGHHQDSDVSDADVFDAANVDKTKDEATVNIITVALQHNFLFQKLSTEVLQAVAHSMKEIQVTANQIIIRQGDEGDKFYVVNSGTFEVRVRPPGCSPDGGDGEVVATYEAGQDLHPCFGDLALMYGQPRAATVTAVTDGKLWALERNVFRSVMRSLASLDPTRLITRAIRKLPLLRPLDLQQIQRMVQLLKEKTFVQEDIIIRKGQISDKLYLVLNGSCGEVEESTSADGETIFLGTGKMYSEYDCFGENGLQSEELIAATTIQATTDMKVLTISKAAFEKNFGPLQEVIEIQTRRRESFSQGLSRGATFTTGVTSQGTSKLNTSLLKGLVSTDPLGSLMFGKFAMTNSSLDGGSNSSAVSGKGSVALPVNAVVRSFIISEIDRQLISTSAKNFMLAVRTIVACRAAATNIPLCYSYLPKYHSLLRDSNAIHLIFKESIVADLSDCIEKLSEITAQTTGEQSVPNCSESVALYVVSCVVKALDALHNMSIVYRSVQPEGIHVTVEGKVVLFDYKICKVGGIGSKTFTICGASDYLAPEQLANAGYGSEVDLWALGVLLFELVCGTNPFFAPTEVAIYKNIASFGSPKFKTLRFHNDASDNVMDLINNLLVPDPNARLGSGIAKDSLLALKRHSFFPSGFDWEEGTYLLTQKLLPSVKSPLQHVAMMLTSEAISEGLDTEVLAKFSQPYVGSGWDKDIEG